MSHPPLPLVKYLHVRKKLKKNKKEKRFLLVLRSSVLADEDPAGVVAMVGFPGQSPLLQGRGWLSSWVPAWGLSCPALGMLSVPEQIILAPVSPPSVDLGPWLGCF